MKSADPQNGTQSPKLKVAILILLLVACGWIYFAYGDTLNLKYLAQQEQFLRGYQRDHPNLVYGIAFLVYVAITGLSLPGAAVLTLAYGWYFGFATAFIIVSFASTAGATLAFILSRYLFRDTIVRKFGDRLEAFNRRLASDGPFYLFTLRLIPAVPFFVINAVMGLTQMRVATFWWVSQLGMLPGTAAYVYAGSSVPHLQTLAERGAKGIISPQLLLAFAVLGILPLAAKLAVGAATKKKNAHSPDGNR